MADGFDPYYEWLGIAPDERPANHYRLLGLRLFEANPSAIQNAADRQMIHLRTFQSGQRSADSQRLLNEVAAAKLCLLKAASKAAYDQALRAKLATPLQANQQPQRAVPIAARPAPVANAPQIIAPASVPNPLQDVAELSHDLARRKPKRRGKASNQLPLYAFAGLGLVVAVVLAGVIIANRATRPQETSATKPAEKKARLADEPPSEVAPKNATTTTKEEAAAADEAAPVRPASQRAVEQLKSPVDEPREPAVRKGEMVAEDEPTSVSEPVVDSEPALPPPTKVASVKPAAIEQKAPPVAPAVPKADVAGDADEWINLLAWAEEHGSWKSRGIDWDANLAKPVTNNALKLKESDGARYPLPAIVDGEYDLEFNFVRERGANGIAFFFPVAGHNMHLEISLWGNHTSFLFVDGAALTDFTGQYAVTNNQPHRLMVHVRRDGDEADIHIDLDDVKDFLRWRGAAWRLASHESNVWMLSTTRRPWVGSWSNSITFNKIRIRKVSGEIRRDYRNAADREDDRRHGIVRLVDLPVSAPVVGFSKFCISQIPLDRKGGDEELFWPMVSTDCTLCSDFYYAHAPSKLKCPIPKGAKSFAVTAYNMVSRTTKYSLYVDGKLVDESGVSPLVSFAIPLAPGASLLELVVDSAGSNDRDQAFWCNPRYFNVPPAKITPAMRNARAKPNFSVANAEVGASQFKHNEADEWTILPMNPSEAVPCDEFLFAHANSSLTYAAPTGMTRFTAVGYSSKANRVRFEVWADAEMIYQSPVSGLAPVNVKLPAGVKTIELRTKDAGSDGIQWTMWCYPRFHAK